MAVTRNGKVAAVLISKQDLETLERLEMEADVRAYSEARAADDGERVSLEELETEIGEAVFRVEFTSAAARQVRKLPPEHRRRSVRAVAALSGDPRLSRG